MRRLGSLLLAAALLALPGPALAQSLPPSVIECPLPTTNLDGSVSMPDDLPVECLLRIAPVPATDGAFFDAAFTGLVIGDDLTRAAFETAGQITYADGILRASVGCNGVSAPFALDTSGVEPRLQSLGEPMITLMYCEGLMDAEAALLRILGSDELVLGPDGISGPTGLIRIPGGVALAMAGSGTGKGEVAPFTPPAGGVAIRAITQNGVESYAINTGWLRLVNGELGASVGCNTISGSYTLDADGRLTLGDLIRTEMFCIDLDAQETALLAVLGGADLRLDLDTLSSAAGTVTLAEAAATPIDAEPLSDGVGLAWLLLLLPLAAGATAIAVGLASVREEKR